MVAEKDAAIESVLDMLARRHGLGGARDEPPGWMRSRVHRLVDDLIAERGESPEELVGWLQRDPALLGRFVDALRIGETSFYRDPPQFDAVRAAVRERWPGRRVRALSVGCSSGEEAWGLAMILDAGGRNFTVVGMDRDVDALATATRGEYPLESTQRLPAELASRYCEDRAGRMRVVDGLRDRVRFVRRDALDGPPPGAYDLVLCRNVLIYLDETASERILTRMAVGLCSDGVIVVGRSEVARVRTLGRPSVDLGGGIVGFR